MPARPAAAHDLRITRVELALDADGSFSADVVADLDALALGVAPGSDSAEVAAALVALPATELEERVAALDQLFRRRARVLFDGTPADFAVSFPERGPGIRETPTGPTLLGLVARLSGTIPAGATTAGVRLSLAFPPVHLTVRHPGGGETRRLVEAGGESHPVPIGGPEDAESAWTVAGRYLVFGFVHIVPAGLDHVLFVLGLFLLSPRLRPLLWQVTAFTAAHTLTLALSASGVVALPAAIVEPAIALSIAAVAIENVVVRELKPWRPALVFAFGLLHGLGFAGVLGELGLPSDERVVALLSFNAGVELGQLAVLAVAFALLGPWRERPWYRSRVSVPLSVAIAVVGLTWTLQRALGG